MSQKRRGFQRRPGDADRPWLGSARLRLSSECSRGRLAKSACIGAGRLPDSQSPIPPFLGKQGIRGYRGQDFGTFEPPARRVPCDAARPYNPCTRQISAGRRCNGRRVGLDRVVADGRCRMTGLIASRCYGGTDKCSVLT
jgi:hypothetical protein